jgi:Sugar (and other) transporter
MIPQENRQLSTSEIRVLSLASIGGALEFYDFVIFVFFATIIGKLFFASSRPDWVRQAQTFGIFAAGYLARPIGGIVMAHFGDTRGRKRVFTLSVLLMAIPTLLIGLLPTYQSIGVAAAPASLVDADHAGCSNRRRSTRRLGLRCRACQTWKDWFRGRLAHRGVIVTAGQSSDETCLRAEWHPA